MPSPFMFGFGEAEGPAEQQQINAPSSHLVYYPIGQTQGVVLEFDVLEKEDITLEAEVTRFPVEKGSEASDHIIGKPDGVKIDAVITNGPSWQKIHDASKTYIEPLPGKQGEFKLLDDTPTRAKPADDARKVLQTIKDGGLVCDLYLGTQKGGREYEQMGMESCSMSRDVQTGDALRFSASFRKLKFVTGQAAAVQGEGGPTKDAGAKPAPPAPKKVATKARGTLLHQVKVAAAGG